MKTIYNKISNIESFLLRTERIIKNRFYILLPCTIICLAGFGITLLTGEYDFYYLCFISVISTIIIACQIHIWYCYYQTKRNRKNYQNLLREQKKEMKAWIDEVSSKGQK